MAAKQEVLKAFRAEYGGDPDVLVRSPGRVNLIGEHTDYNEGFVMPMAIEQSLYLAARRRADLRVAAHSLDFRSRIDFSLGDLESPGPAWGEFLKGMAWALREGGHPLAGWEGVLGSEIPIGAGLSSSASLELGTGLVFQSLSGFRWDPVEMARIGQRVENAWIGVNSGIMDQMIIALGQPDAALKIDCRSLEAEAVPLPEGVRIVVIDSATRRGDRGLADSAYNDRRGECEAAAAWFGIASLRELTIERLEADGRAMPPTLFKRARHVLTEDARVHAGAAAMRRGDAGALGEIIRQGHASQREDFETSRPEIDSLVDLANAQPGCFGARLTGGGFGGCAVALVEENGAEAFRTAVAAAYRAAAGLEAAFYTTRAMAGVRILPFSDE